MPNIGPPEILIISIVVMVLFGAKRLPDSARALGRSMRIFKAETKGLRADDDATIQQPPAQLPPAAPAAPSAAPAPDNEHRA